MTNLLRKEISDILEYLKKNDDISDYKVDESTTIKIKTSLADEDDINFLKFRIISAIAVIDEELENIINIEIL